MEDSQLLEIQESVRNFARDLLAIVEKERFTLADAQAVTFIMLRVGEYLPTDTRAEIRKRDSNRRSGRLKRRKTRRNG